MTVPLRPSSFIHLEVIVLQSMAAAETTNFTSKLSTLATRRRLQNIVMHSYAPTDTTQTPHAQRHYAMTYY